MIVIEDNGKIKFFKDGVEISRKAGFKHLDEVYGNEPQETKKTINRLKEKYYKDLYK